MARVLVNQRTRETVATSVELAATRQSRRRGLLGRDRMEASAAMMLVPCSAVHTAFMRFPIDVVVIDRQGYRREGGRTCGPGASSRRCAGTP